MRPILPYLQKYLPNLRPYKKLYLLGFLGVLFEVSTNLFSPWSMKLVIDTILASGNNKQGLSLFLVRIALILLALGLIRAWGIYLQIIKFEGASQLVARDLRNKLYDHVQRLPFAFHNSTRTGEIMSRVTSDVNCIREAFGFGSLFVVLFIAYYTSVIAVLFYINWKFTLVASITMPIIIYTGIKYRGKVDPLFDKLQEEIAKFTAIVQENVSGIRVVKAFFKEKMEIKRFTKQNNILFDTNMSIVKMNAFYHPLMDFLTSMATALILLYGGREVIQNRASIGLLVAFSGYLMMLVWPVRMVGFILSMIQKGDAAAERITKLLEEEKLPDTGTIELDQVKGEIRFENVCFSYPDSQEYALEDINIDIKPGEVIALVGTTGSGKSTLIQLIPRFFDATSGRITLDGIDIKDIRLSNLRNHIALVFQENFLFSATIRENIAFGRPEVTFEEIVRAAKSAQADGFIRELPNGYDTVVGERGIGLSGGQRQRIAIARALLKDPKILILDDSTSSVDQETERQIQKALENLMRNRTTFIIAQRLSSVKMADQILVLDNGRIVERGKHEELLTRDGFYKRIYDIQWGQREALLNEMKEDLEEQVS
jgi:ATP-binding cassette subfamily B protein